MTTATKERKYTVKLRSPHTKQEEIRQSLAKRKIVRAGRRGGKTVIAATICVDKFLEGLRPLYATPTSDQLETWWFEVKAQECVSPRTARVRASSMTKSEKHRLNNWKGQYDVVWDVYQILEIIGL